MRGKNQEAVPQLVAGDIGAVAKLADTHTGDTLCLHEKPVTLPGIEFPDPAYSAAVYPKTKADLDKMSGSLARMVEEDPTLRVARNADTAETIVSGLGESHVQVSIEKLARKFSLELNVAIPKVPYKETVMGSATSEYIHKKQTGGHGQYARVAIEIQPLPRGEGFQFEDKIVGGVVPRQYIPSVEKGVIEGLHEGVLAGFPVTDIKVRLVDGKDHPVDSSDIAFKIAGAMAFKKGAQDARPVLLEPIVDLSITVPDSYTGDIISDLNGRRARVHGMTPAGNGHTVIEAQAPLAETQRYATDLRSLTQGRGSFSMEFSHYEEVPQQQAQRVIDEAQRAEAQRV
jgi:elongation factor G